MSKWNVLVANALQRRTSPEQFASLVELLLNDAPADGQLLCSLVLERAQPKDGFTDPLVAKYLDRLLSRRFVQPHDLLKALLSYKQSISSADNDTEVAALASLEQRIMISLARHFSSDTIAPESIVAIKLVPDLTAWMTYLAAQNSDMTVQEALTSSTTVMHAIITTRESFAMMILTCLQNLRVRQQMTSEIPEETAIPLAESFTSFITLMSATNMQLASRLQMTQKEMEYLQVHESSRLINHVDGDQHLGQLHLESIVDTEPINTRASFAVFLEGILDGRPHASDSIVIGFMQSRHKGDHHTAIVDFIVACFDTIGLAMTRGDSAERTFIQHSFLTNKAPAIILYLSSASFVPVDTEILISEALGRLDPGIFESFPDGDFIESQGNLLSEARRQFVFACVNLGLLGRDSIPRILGEEVTGDVHFEGRLQKQQLLEECKGNSNKLSTMIDKMEAHDGNAPTRVEAVVEIFHNTCASQDKAALKSLCNQIPKKAQILDGIALYSDVRSFLQPMCFLLAEWKHDEDEGEHQPIYDEFSACILLLLAMSSRFNLSAEELGFPTEISFWCDLLNDDVPAMLLKDLGEERDQRLSGWIKGLFITHGLGDELLSSCSPQEFYTLAPTLFQQTLIACKASILDEEHLKNGLELLLYTFLMPALIPSFQWLIDNAQERNREIDVCITIIDGAIYPQALDGDAAGMHATMLSILGDRLIDFLENCSASQSKIGTIAQQLVEKLRPYSRYHRAAEATAGQMRTWTNDGMNSILDNVRNTLRGLSFWTTNTGLQAGLPTYSNMLVRTAVRTEGAESTLNAIIEEINVQMATGLGEAALEIATAMIVGNAVSNGNALSARLSLQDMLLLEVLDAPKSFSTKDADHGRTQTCVRLSRRVEALLANIAAAATEQQHQQAMQMPLPDAMMSDMGLDAATAAAVGLGPSDQVPHAGDATASNPLDFTGGGDDLQLNLDAVLPGQNQQATNVTAMVGEQGQAGDVQMAPSAEDDIFADLWTDPSDYGF